MTEQSLEPIRPSFETLYHAIEAAHDLIVQHVDGPVSMRRALRDIEEHVGTVETECAVLNSLVQDLITLAIQLRSQRDEALTQRDEAYTQGWHDALSSPDLWHQVLYILHANNLDDI